MPNVAGGKRTNTREDHRLRAAFFEEGKRLDADPETRALSVCWICKTRIDYDAAPGTSDESHNLDHFKAVRDFPELQSDPTNFRHSHRVCNIDRGADAPELGLGVPVPAWW